MRGTIAARRAAGAGATGLHYDGAMLVNAYATHRSPPALSFPHQLRGRRDRTDPELEPHLRGFIGFILRDGRAMTTTRYAVMRHLERVQHHVALDLAEDAVGAFRAWARAANAIVFHEDARVTDPDGRLLVHPETGEPERGAAVPFLADALERRARTQGLLEARAIATPHGLPPVVAEGEVALRAPEAVALRAVALFACALRAESLAAGQPIPPADIAARLPLARTAMSPNEGAFFDAAAPERQAIVNHVWRYESLALLLWALGELDELPFPTAIADVPALAKLMLARTSPEFPRAATLRAPSAILDALDLAFRLHWATTDARVRKSPAPLQGLEPGVVFERHHAANWLTQFGGAEWDDVETPT